MKKCNRCGLEREEDHFNRRSHDKAQTVAYCKTCVREYDASRREKLKSTYGQRDLPRTKKCFRCKQTKDKSCFTVKRDSKSGLNAHCRSCERNNKLTKNYGIDSKDYDRMFESQEGACKICRKQSRQLHVDHCHDSGKVRGLLCINCNNGLGRFKDNTQYLESAKQYLLQVETQGSVC